MAAVRPLRRARIWSRSADNARRFAAAAAARYGFPIEAAASARTAVEGADLVCTTTAATAPVLEGAWLAPGAHVNAVGACLRHARELDAAAVARARLYVDARESALAEAGDFLLAKAEGAVGDDHIAGEIGEVVRGTVPGRRSPEEITLFESLGIAVEDVVAAHLIYRKALASGAGTWLELGAARDAAV
jgi:ornithine cyclodeaminase